ncbi:MAG: PorT family protein, partial [Bacteroidia bacterium]|nr:PorT family protein [Bacteroidia bacterium]
MKKIILLSVCLGILLPSQAQDIPFIDFGLKAGINGSWIRGLEDDFERDGSKIGFQAGVYARLQVPLLGFNLQPELLISQTGGRVRGTFLDPFDNPYEGTNRLTLTTLDIPVLIGQRYGIGPIGVRGQIGPVFQMVLDANYV